MNDSITQQPIYSTFGDDELIGELVEMLVDEMPERIAAFEDAYASRDFDTLRSLAHQLKGAGGSYGFATLTTRADVVERAIQVGEPEPNVRKVLDDLIAVCRVVRAGTQPTSR